MKTIILLACCTGLPLFAAVGEFESAADVGKCDIKGSASFDDAKKQYKVTGSGENMWKETDAFQFVSKKMNGDLEISFDVEWVGEGKNKHRKACAIVRQSADADAAYADVAVHGDGMIGLQFRKTKGAVTEAMKSTIKNPATVTLTRVKNEFTMTVKPKDGAAEKIGPVTVELTDPVLVGLAVCSHDVTVAETAIFSNVKIGAPAGK